MPPKLDIDVKLKQLRGYIAANLSQLASGDRTTLKAIFAARKRESNADANFYKFLWSNERTFTDAQRAHAEETMAMVNRHRANSGDAHPAAAVGHENSGKEESVQGSGVSQLAVHEPAKEVKLKAAGKGAKNKALDHKVLLLQLKRPHYDAIKSRRKLWEARPLVDSKARGWQPSIFNKLAQVGRTVVLQSGAGTNDRVRVAEVRRYTSGTDAGASAVQDMVVDLNADLLPDVVGARERAEVYTDLYGHQRCAGGFVAMRLEWPCEASTAASVGVHQG